MDIPINPPAMPNTISGLTLTPLVSSSKNLNRPALEAGNGAFFFLLLICSYLFGWLKYILFDTFMATYYLIIKGSFIVDTIYTYIL